MRNSNQDTVLLFNDYESDEMSIRDEQQKRLLDNSDRIERAGNRLADGYRTILETEQLGTAVLQDLSQQRETLQRSRSRVGVFLSKSPLLVIFLVFIKFF